MPTRVERPRRRPRPGASALLFLLLVLLAGSAAAAELRMLGWLEWSRLQPGHVRLKTKLDTGARTSSIDATDIEAFERDGEPWVRFRIPLSKRPEDTDREEDLLLERPIVREVRIKDHKGPSRSRYVVPLRLCVAGLTFETPVSLADRSRFHYPLLLGRLALRERFLVDASRTFTEERSCRTPADSAPAPEAGA